MRILRNFGALIVGFIIIQYANKTPDWALVLHLLGITVLLLPALEILYNKATHQGETDQLKQDSLDNNFSEAKSNQKGINMIFKSGCAIGSYIVVYIILLSLVTLLFKDSSTFETIVTATSGVGVLGFAGVAIWSINYFSRDDKKKGKG